MKGNVFLIGLFAAVILLTACNGKKQQEREQHLKDSFAQILNGKDSELDGLFKELNQIDASLTEITGKYGEVSKVANTSNEISKDTKANIRSNIDQLSNLLEQNKKKLANVNAKLSKTNKSHSEMTAFVENLQKRIAEQEEQIQSLNRELNAKNVQIESLTKNVNDLNEQAKKRDAQLLQIEDEKNAAYYVIGTKSDLLNKKVIDRKGGFIGIGRSSVLASNVDYGNLTRIDIRTTNEIALSGKNIKIITSHPKSSYELMGKESNPTSIRILNPEDFWKANRCLIIQEN